MSNLLNKAKDALSGNKSHDTTTTSSTHGTHTTHGTHGHATNTTAGPHSSNAMNKADPRIDSDLDGRGIHSNAPGHGTTGTTGGLTGNSDMTGTTGTSGLGHGTSTSTNAGPHNSNLLNKVDPRVDSDRDGRNDPTSHTGGYGQTQSGYTGTGATTGTTTGMGGVGHGTSTNAGPHNSNMMNKLDPRVDSDRDGRDDPSSRVGGMGQSQDNYSGVGTTGTTTGAGYGTGHSGAGGVGHGASTTGAGYGTGHSGVGGVGHSTSTNAGPHDSNLMNKVDPRVDSDRDGRNDPSSRVGGYGQTQDTYTGTTGTGAGMNTGTHGTHTTHGTEGTTAGMQSDKVHNSSLLNKLDPRTKTDSQGNPI